MGSSLDAKFGYGIILGDDWEERWDDQCFSDATDDVHCEHSSDGDEIVVAYFGYWDCHAAIYRSTLQRNYEFGCAQKIDVDKLLVDTKPMDIALNAFCEKYGVEPQAGSWLALACYG